MPPNRRNRCLGNLDIQQKNLKARASNPWWQRPWTSGQGPCQWQAVTGRSPFEKQFKWRFVKEINYHRQDIFVGERSIPTDPFAMIVRNQDMCNVLKWICFRFCMREGLKIWHKCCCVPETSAFLAGARGTLGLTRRTLISRALTEYHRPHFFPTSCLPPHRTRPLPATLCSSTNWRFCANTGCHHFVHHYLSLCAVPRSSLLITFN